MNARQKPPRCHWDGEDRVTAQHLKSCNSAGCEGCKPCAEPHCAMPRCNRHLSDHEPTRCGRCVGAVRGDLKRIGDLCKLAPIAATEGGINSPVFALDGPVPERSSYDARWHWAVRPGGGLCRCASRNQDCPDQLDHPAGPACRDDKCAHQTCRRIRYQPACPDLVAWLDFATDEQHPKWVLGTWDLIVALHLGHVRTSKVTIASTVSYLDRNLTDLARDEDFGFDDMARELAQCKDHVEDVLLVAEYIQRGAPCPVCVAAGRKPKSLERLFDPDSTIDETGMPDDGTDLWVCPTSECRQTWTVTEYRDRIEGVYVEQAAWLPARQLAARLRVPEGSIRGWSSLGHVRRRKAGQGLTEYNVSDAERQRDKKQLPAAGEVGQR